MFIRKLISPITMKQNNDSVQKNDKSQKTLKTSFIALAATGVTLALVAPYTKKDILKTLKSNGLEIKNGIVVSSQTGEKFTGALKFNSKVDHLHKALKQNNPSNQENLPKNKGYFPLHMPLWDFD